MVGVPGAECESFMDISCLIKISLGLELLRSEGDRNINSSGAEMCLPRP